LRRPSDTVVVARLLALLNSVTADELINQLRYVYAFMPRDPRVHFAVP